MVSILIHIKLILLYVHSTMKLYKHMEIPCIVDIYSLSIELSKSPNTGNKSKISYTFAPKEICRKHYIIEQISGSLHEIRLYNIQFMYIFCYRKFNFFCSERDSLPIIRTS